MKNATVGACRLFAVLVVGLSRPELMGGSGTSVSDTFQIDTGGRVSMSMPAFSADFSISTRGGASGYANSAFVTIDTRDKDNRTVGFAARAQSDSGGALVGVTVSVWQNGTVLASSGTDESGQVRLTGLFAGYYELRAEKPGHLTQVRRHVRVPEDVSGGVSFILPTPPVTPSITEATTAPAESLINPPRIPSIAQLRVFADVKGNWDPSAKVDRNKMTVVMTHGCDSDPDEWALPMARKMAA